MIVNNQETVFIDEIKSLIHKNSDVYISTNFFTINAFYNLLDELKSAKSVKVLLEQNQFDDNKSFLIKDPLERLTDLELESYFRLNQIKKFNQDNIQIRKGPTSGTNYISIDQKIFLFTPHRFNELTLGLIKDGSTFLITYLESGAEELLKYFNIFWESSKDFKEELNNIYEQASPLVSPETVYKYTISQIFEDKTIEDINEDRLNRTGFKNSKVWNMLFNFQKDAVLGAIDKIEKYNGCIIADSVGLGKTFEALAVIKYYELRNDRVLVLAPKKLRDNWVTYRLNDKRNILESDRFNFDVLNHTDLSRETGMSGEMNLETVNWGNYDLIVIDESHNFRNNNPKKGRVSRYEKLLNDVILKGVKTKVLLLSATPVNTRLNDLKNQLAFITENNDQALLNEGITSIELTLKAAQTKFNNWLKKDEPTREDLINDLGGDYFKLLDIFTISRSRKHIEKYYDVADIGHFPDRLTPITINSDFDTENKDFSITDINDELERLNLRFYSPMYFLLDSKKEEYSNKYDTITKTGAIFTQLAREESIITLMRVNLLKRLESSIYSFRLTLSNILEHIDHSLEKVDQHKEYSEDLDISKLDFEDEQFEDLVIGGKIKVLMQDLDLIKFKQFLQEDRNIIARLIKKCEEISSERDQKMKDLVQIIENKIENPINPENKKVIVFSAFSDTANYLYNELASYFKTEFNINSALVTGNQVKTNMDSIKADFNNILINFSPKSKSRAEIFEEQEDEIDLLFCTDCISEGQNLQDSDYLVNYDIHWNPVRIIQRFGRIDRIGTDNQSIQLVNFFPNLELDQYINLVGRVQGRMQILDISTTGDENVIKQGDSESKELDYRRKQLQKMKEMVVDLEDLDGGISISDLTFNDFKVDADRLTDEELLRYEVFAPGVFSLAENRMIDQEAGVLFCLKDVSGKEYASKVKTNLLHPYNLIYITESGEVLIPNNLGKKTLDLFKKTAYGKLSIKQELLSNFNNVTKSGRYMSKYKELLSVATDYLSGEKENQQHLSIFDPAGSNLGEKISSKEYEILSYLIIE